MQQNCTLVKTFIFSDKYNTGGWSCKFITKKGLDIQASATTVAPLVKCQCSWSTTPLLHPTQPKTLSPPHPSLKHLSNISNQPRTWPHYNLSPYQPYQPSLRRMSLNQSNKNLNQINMSLKKSNKSLNQIIKSQNQSNNQNRKEFLAICTTRRKLESVSL